MIRKFSLLQKFSLICLLMLILLGIMLNLAINFLMEKNLIKHAEEMTSAVIRGEVIKELHPDELRTPLQGDAYHAFAAKISRLSLGHNIERIKVWSPDYQVIWADMPEMVGRRYADNHGIEEVLSRGGEVVEMTWKGHERTESEHELESDNHGKRLLELYVPITFPGSPGIDIIFEVYRNMDPLYAEFNHQQRIVWCIIFSSFGLLYLALFSLVFRATRKIERQRIGLLESEAKYRNLIGSAQDGILAVDQQGRIVLCNSAAQRIFGYLAEDMIEMPLGQLMPEEKQPQTKSALQDFFAQGGSRDGELLNWQGRRANGESFPLALTFAVSGDADARIVTAILRDETERQVMQEKALEAEKLSGISVIASSIGHEINNAISGLYGYGQLLHGRSGDAAFVDKCAATMLRQAEQLRLHANNLLGIGNKPQPPKFGPLDLNQVFAQVTDLLQMSGVTKYLTLVQDFSTDLPLIAGDPHQLEQLMRNLQINAVHAMGRKGTLTLRSALAEDGRVFFDIEDTGTGISSEQLEKVFEPFFTTKDAGKGTGLGLYIVRQIVEQHGGELQVDSKVGIGTRFRILFPVSFSRVGGLNHAAAIFAAGKCSAVVKQPTGGERSENDCRYQARELGGL